MRTTKATGCFRLVYDLVTHQRITAAMSGDRCQGVGRRSRRRSLSSESRGRPAWRANSWHRTHGSARVSSHRCGTGRPNTCSRPAHATWRPSWGLGRRRRRGGIGCEAAQLRGAGPGRCVTGSADASSDGTGLHAGYVGSSRTIGHGGNRFTTGSRGGAWVLVARS